MKYNSNSWIEQLALPTGHFFSLREDYSDRINGYFVFEHLNVPNHLLIIEPNEITFKYYNNVLYENKDYFVISLNNNSSASAIIETNLIELSNHLLFVELFTDFLIDLYANNAFKESGKIQNIKLALDSIPLIQGITQKSLFYYYSSQFLANKNKSKVISLTDKIKENKQARNVSNNYFKRLWTLKLPDITRSESKNTNSEEEIEIINQVEERIINKLKLSFHNWTIFLLSPKNEKYFKIDNNWFESDLDLELIEAKKRLHNGLEKTKENNLDIADTRSIANYFIRRYGIFESISLAWQREKDREPYSIKKDGFKIGLFLLKRISGSTITKFTLILLGLTFLSIISNLAFFNLKLSNPFPKIIPYIFLINIIWIVILGYFSHVAKLFPALLLPRMVIAIISGWLLFLTAEELLKIDYDLTGYTILTICGATIFLLFVFMINEIKNYAYSMNTKVVNGRAILLILFSFCISYFFGFFVMSYVNKKFISLDNFLVSESSVVKENEIGLKNMEIKRELNGKFRIFTLDFQDRLKDPIYRNKTYNGKINSNSMIRATRYLKPKINQMDLLISDLSSKDPTFFSQDSLVATSFKQLKRIYSDLKTNRNTSFWSKKMQAIDKIVMDFVEINDRKRQDLIALENKYNNTNLNLEFDNVMAEKGVEINGQIIRTQSFSMPGFTIRIFPNLVFFRSILAMFIGVFLQLIIQDKSVTEPL